MGVNASEEVGFLDGVTAALAVYHVGLTSARLSLTSVKCHFACCPLSHLVVGGFRLTDVKVMNSVQQTYWFG